MARERRGRERKIEREEEREKRPHSRFALQAPIQWTIKGYVIKKRARSNVLFVSDSELYECFPPFTPTTSCTNA